MADIFDLTDKSIEKLSNSIAKALGKVSGFSGGISRGASRSSDAAEQRAFRNEERQRKSLGKAQEELRKATEELAALSKRQIKNTKKGQDALERYNKALEDVSSSMEEMSEKYDDLTHKSLDKQYRAFNDLAKNTHGLSSALASMQVNSSQLAASFLKGHELIDKDTEEYKSYMRDIRNSMSVLDKEYLKQAKLIDETTGSIKENLSPEDIAKIRVQIGQTQALINENLSKIGIENLAELTQNREALEQRLAAAGSEGIKSGEQFRDALMVIAQQLKEKGHQLGGMDLTQKDKVNYAELAKQVAAVNTSANAAATGLNTVAWKANTVIGKQFYGMSTLMGKVAKNLLDSAIIIANVKTAVDKSKELYKQVMDFNIAQIPASFAEVNKMSFMLGMSFEDTVKLLQENKRTLATFGPAASKDLFDSMTNTMTQFGYTAKQAASAIGPTIEAAAAAGVNTRDANALNKFMGDTAQAFGRIKGVVNITAEEYSRLNAELLSSQDVQANILGMDQQRGQEYASQIIALRDNYKLMGMSTQQAQELVKIQEQQKREKVTSRVREAAKAMMLGQQVGMSPEDAQEMFQLAIKGRAASPEETKRLQALTGQMKGLSETAVQAGYDTDLGAGMVAQTMVEKLTPEGALGKMAEAGGQLEMLARAGKNLTDKEIERTKILSDGNPLLAKFGNFVNSVSSVVNNVFIGALGASITALFGLTAQAIWAARALGGISGKGLLEGIKDTITGKGTPTPGAPTPGAPTPGAPTPGAPAPGKGGMVGRIAKGVAGGAGALLGGMALDYASEKAIAAGNQKTGATLDIASTMLSAGGMGAAIGSIIAPGPGTAIGAGVGALAGGAYGLYKNAGSLFGTAAPTATPTVAVPTGATSPASMASSGAAGIAVSAADVNTRATQVTNMVDAGANEKLSIIIQRLTEAVAVLKGMSPPVAGAAAPGTFTAGQGTRMPTALEYQTGR